MKTKQTWKTIKDYPNYLISNWGRVRSLRINKNLKPQSAANGYRIVRLYNCNGYIQFYIHRLVAQAFLPEDAYRTYVDHISGIKSDNRLHNLRRCTQQENMSYWRQKRNKEYIIYG